MSELKRRDAMKGMLVGGAAVALSGLSASNAELEIAIQNSEASQTARAFRGQHQPKPLPFDPAKLSGLSIPETLKRLKEAGLDSVPGGGAEILVDSVRAEISPKKIGWQGWADVMREAAKLGMPTTATMMFGSTETREDIVEHLFRVRALQAEGGSFTAFIPWTYQPGNTELGGKTATGVEYLKVLALSRIVLDNIPNIQASWVTQGARMAQVALFFGANDLGGTMLEENVVAAAGCSFRMSREEMIQLIRGAGFLPVRRTTTYTILEEYT